MALRSAAEIVPLAVTGGLLALLPLALTNEVAAAGALGSAGIVALAAGMGVSRAGTILVIIAMVLAPMHALVLPQATFVTYSDVFLVVGLALLAPRFVLTHAWLPTPFVIGAAIFVATGLVAGMQVENLAEGYFYFFRILVMHLLLPLAFVWWRPRGRVLVALAAAFVLGTAISFSAGIVKGGGSAFRLAGFAEHPNGLGYTGLLAACLIPFLWHSARHEHRWLVVAGGLAAGGAVMLSGSRAALVALALVAVIYPLLERSIRLALPVAAVAVVAFATIDWSRPREGHDALSRLLGGGTAIGSDLAREQRAAAAWQTFIDNPILGVGFRPVETFEAHNLYLQIAGGVGIVGFAGYLLILGSFLLAIRNRDVHYRLLAYPGLAFIVAGPASPNVTDRFVGLPLALALVGACLAHEDWAARRSEPTAVPAGGHGRHLRRSV